MKRVLLGDERAEPFLMASSLRPPRLCLGNMLPTSISRMDFGIIKGSSIAGAYVVDGCGGSGLCNAAAEGSTAMDVGCWMKGVECIMGVLEFR
jgi:hypothetical protein